MFSYVKTHRKCTEAADWKTEASS